MRIHPKTSRGTAVEDTAADLSSLSKHRIEIARQLLARYQFKSVETKFGTAYSFRQPAGVSLLKMALQINKAANILIGRDAILEGNLLRDKGMKQIFRRAQVHQCIPVVNGSHKLNAEFKDEVLAENGLLAVERRVLTVGAGLFRLAHGDPKKTEDIGTSTDPGDIFKGHVVKCLRGAVTNNVYGVRDIKLGVDFDANLVAVAGTIGRKAGQSRKRDSHSVTLIR